MKRANGRSIELDKNLLDELRQRIATRQLHPGDRELIKMLLESYTQLITSLKDENTTMDQLQELLAAGQRNMAQAMTATPPAKIPAAKTTIIVCPFRPFSAPSAGTTQPPPRSSHRRDLRR